MSSDALGNRCLRRRFVRPDPTIYAAIHPLIRKAAYYRTNVTVERECYFRLFQHFDLFLWELSNYGSPQDRTVCVPVILFVSCNYSYDTFRTTADDVDLEWILTDQPTIYRRLS